MPRHVPAPQREFAKLLRSNQTAIEEAFWRELRAKRLGGRNFNRQVPLGFYIVDFVCFEARLVVEADGPLHGDPEQHAHDLRRDAFLRREGFRVLRFGQDRS